MTTSSSHKLWAAKPRKGQTKSGHFAFSALAALTLFSGCGPQAFDAASLTESTQAPGTFTVPPKVDILLAWDNMGGINQMESQLESQVPAFLTNLQSSGWDYHFVTIPLTTDQPINQVLASKYDSGWGSLWTPAYPGQSSSDPDMVVGSFFATPTNYAGISGITTSNTLNGVDPGFETIRLALYNRVQGTGFLRPDAMLAIVVIDNGEDTSGVSYSTPAGGVPVPDPTSLQTSMNYYQTAFQNVKSTVIGGSASYGPTSFYAIAATAAHNNSTGSYCDGGYSFAGTRYEQMATLLNGTSQDICTIPISTALTSLAGSLQSTRLNYRTHYLFIDQDANPSTIQVQVTNNGATTTIPQSTTNGWTYVGMVNNVYTIDSPTPLNLASGYAIKLNGTAELTGSETASVTFQPAGTTNVTSN